MDNMKTIENIAELVAEADDRARALIVAFAQGFAQGVEAERKSREKEIAETDETTAADED